MTNPPERGDGMEVNRSNEVATIAVRHAEDAFRATLTRRVTDRGTADFQIQTVRNKGFRTLGRLCTAWGWTDDRRGTKCPFLNALMLPFAGLLPALSESGAAAQTSEVIYDDVPCEDAPAPAEGRWLRGHVGFESLRLQLLTSLELSRYDLRGRSERQRRPGARQRVELQRVRELRRALG